MNKKSKNKGWRNEPIRHSLASQGISTKMNTNLTSHGRDDIFSKETLNEVAKKIKDNYGTENPRNTYLNQYETVALSGRTPKEIYEEFIDWLSDNENFNHFVANLDSNLDVTVVYDINEHTFHIKTMASGNWHDHPSVANEEVYMFHKSSTYRWESDSIGNLISNLDYIVNFEPSVAPKIAEEFNDYSELLEKANPFTEDDEKAYEKLTDRWEDFGSEFMNKAWDVDGMLDAIVSKDVNGVYGFVEDDMNFPYEEFERRIEMDRDYPRPYDLEE